MKTKGLPTVDEMNQAQAEWMKLDIKAPVAERQRVIQFYNHFVPRSYLAVNVEKTLAKPIVNGTTVWAKERALVEAKAVLENYNRTCLTENQARLDVAWCGAIQKWVTLD